MVDRGCFRRRTGFDFYKGVEGIPNQALIESSPPTFLPKKIKNQKSSGPAPAPLRQFAPGALGTIPPYYSWI